MSTSSITQAAPAQMDQTADMNRVFRLQQANQLTIRHTSASLRKGKLLSLRDWMLANKALIREALYLDFKKPALETDLTEIYPTKKEIEFAVNHVADWMKPKNVATPLALLGTRSKVTYEPKGVSLIMAPWNYPFYLVVAPLVSAIAAGCTAVVKPSELTPHTAKLVHRMMGELFPENEVAVFEGGASVAEALLQLPFNHIFFTGSSAVGKIVMRAAAEHLASVTLELGGKSPAIVDETADLQDAAEKLMWGKFVNNGQTCVAPDYLLVQRNVQAPLLEALQQTIRKNYTADAANSPDYARVINPRHHQRLKHLIDAAVESGAKVVTGGQTSDDDCYLAPTLLTDVRNEMEVMKEEIFGPILPIVSYDDSQEIIRYINAHEKPLALYVFSKDREKANYILNNTSSGGACINDCVVHLANLNLPFGGSNNSGLGNSHGYYGFLAFSHEKAVLEQRVGMTVFKSFYPPYTDKVKKLIEWAIRWF